MEKNIKIGNKEYKLEATTLTLLDYEEEFNKDFLKTLMCLEDKENSEYSNVIVETLRIVYVMLIDKEGRSFREFLKDTKIVTGEEYAWIREVQGLAYSIFQGTTKEEDKQ